ncbi:MAG: fibrillarin-like rRNA/tRNA 2'-O-methyltransferase [Methanomicrobiales archaeon]|nr:fibrillarin-like rRNA/tRNA 2'-O-methyltransferase [Methanomicrobiales archaeon]
MIRIDGVLVSPGEGGVYGERMLGGYRVWDPYRSKLAALYQKSGGPEITPGMTVLYLGAANGTTVSHVADYAGTVYAVEYAPRPMQDLLEVARRRKNVVPILGDATAPAGYAPVVETVDLLYQDVAQPDQAGILLKNAVFLKTGGTAVLMLKTRSVDIRRDPSDIHAETVEMLVAGGFDVIDSCWLEPYHRDHAALVCTRTPPPAP